VSGDSTRFLVNIRTCGDAAGEDQLQPDDLIKAWLPRLGESVLDITRLSSVYLQRVAKGVEGVNWSGPKKQTGVAGITAVQKESKPLQLQEA